MEYRKIILRGFVMFMAVFATVFQLSAQKRSFNLGTDYGLTPADRSVLVGSKFTAGQDTVKLPWAWKALKVQGMTYATFRKLTVTTAYLNDAAWANEAPGNIGRFQNSYNFVEIPVGAYEINATCPVPRRGIKGQSSYQYYGENSVATELIMQSTWYAVNGQTERVMLTSPNWNDATNFSYNESATIENLALTGPHLDDGVVRIGLALRKFGECTYVNQVRSDWFTYGFVASGGVPLTAGTLTAFHNVKGGFVALGSAGMTCNIATLSGDDNAELFGLHPGYGGPAGGIVNIGLLKIETAVTDEARGVWRGQVAAFLEGQFSVNIGVVSCASAFIKTDAMFVVNPSIPAYGPQGAQLTVGSVAHFGYSTALQNIQAGTRVAAPPQYQAFDIRWNAIGNTFVSTYPGLKATACGCKDRLGFIRGTTGSFDYVACTPVYPGSAGGSNPVPPPPPIDPPPPPPSTTLKWSTSFEGSDVSKLMTGSTVNATAWKKLLWTASMSSVGGTGKTKSNSVFPQNIVGATKIVYKGCTFVSSADWTYLNSKVRMMANGNIMMDGSSTVIATMSKTKSDLTIIFPSPVDLTTVIGLQENVTPVFSAESMEVW